MLCVSHKRENNLTHNSIHPPNNHNLIQACLNSLDSLLLPVVPEQQQPSVIHAEPKKVSPYLAGFPHIQPAMVSQAVNDIAKFTEYNNGINGMNIEKEA